jgi:hypothetical protein
MINGLEIKSIYYKDDLGEVIKYTNQEDFDAIINKVKSMNEDLSIFNTSICTPTNNPESIEMLFDVMDMGMLEIGQDVDYTPFNIIDIETNNYDEDEIKRMIKETDAVILVIFIKYTPEKDYDLYVDIQEVTKTLADKLDCKRPVYNTENE